MNSAHNSIIVASAYHGMSPVERVADPPELLAQLDFQRDVTRQGPRAAPCWPGVDSGGAAGRVADSVAERHPRPLGFRWGLHGGRGRAGPAGSALRVCHQVRQGQHQDASPVSHAT